MSTFLIITVAVLYVGIKLYKAGRNLSGDSEVKTSESQPQTAQPAFESLFDEQDGDAGMPSFEEEERSAGYFTYEDIASEVAAEATPMKSKKHHKQKSAVERESTLQLEEEPVQETVDFDLRQAIIYQTILNNKYNPQIQ